MYTAVGQAFAENPYPANSLPSNLCSDNRNPEKHSETTGIPMHSKPEIQPS
jgi:hypothetical protein